MFFLCSWHSINLVSNGHWCVYFRKREFGSWFAYTCLADTSAYLAPHAGVLQSVASTPRGGQQCPRPGGFPGCPSTSGGFRDPVVNCLPRLTDHSAGPQQAPHGSPWSVAGVPPSKSVFQPWWGPSWAPISPEGSDCSLYLSSLYSLKFSLFLTNQLFAS